MLLESVYRSSGPSGTVICSRPGLHPRSGAGHVKAAQAWQSLLEAADDLKAVDTFQFDLVNVSRQALGGMAASMLGEVMTAYHAKDRQALGAASRRFLELIADIDELLATRRELLLGRWIADAKHWATNDAERRRYEWNARNQITLWGPRDSILHEYAQKQWSGMMSGFYGQRWKLFFERLDAALAAGKALDAKQFEQDIRQWEENWTHQTEPYAAEPRGDAVAVSRRLWDKYNQRFFSRDAVSLTTDKPVTCSHALSGYPASLANDGWSRDTDSYWATDVKADPAAWWQVDLEKPTTLGRIVVVFYHADRRYYGFTVETSLDGKRWEMAADRRDNKELSVPQGLTCRFAPRQARYLRVTLPHNSANTGRHLVEVMAFEK